LNVTFVPDDSGVVSVDNEGVVTALREGTATIVVKVGGDGVYAENTTVISVSVSKVTTEITVNPVSLDLFVGDEAVIVVALTPADAGNVAFTSSDNKVVTVDGEGNVKAVGAGKANIMVSFAGDDKYFVTENKTVSVTVSLKDSSISADDIELNVGANATIEVVTFPEGLEVTYVPDNSGVVTVENGVITAIKQGTATVTLKVGGDGIYAENSTAITVTVNKQDVNVNVSMPDNVTVGDNAAVEVTLPSDAGGNVTLKVDGEVIDTVPVTNGIASVELQDLSVGNHTVEIAYSGDDKYGSVSQTKEITVFKKDVTPEITIPSDIEFGDNATVEVTLPSDAGGNVTLKVDGEVIDTVPVTNGTASVELPDLSAGSHTVEIAYSGDDKYNPSTKTAMVRVDMDSTKLTAGNVTATYKVKKYLTITLTDSRGSPIANATVSVELKSLENYTTDANGQIKVKISNLVPKTYTAKITFKGDDNYIGSNTTAKVTVKKASSKITAKAKTFKTTTKTKKYTVKLKNNKGKALKNKWVYLKVNGKTYKAKTNSKGKATFKITKLNKAGKFKATITYKGNDYYKKTTKKVKLKVKTTFKTVSKGSKNHAIVKKIQRALKNNGYYLVYNGQYLKVDGIFWDYTEMEVKHFQHDKKLKVTGKVDEKTAKKLKII
ncbi:Ig-like domain repeat protein, partial [Methanobrevibacter sp.]|uniref:Ig-like domain repeat protein n=1 Tax=Methanobrevibacter sp. TaxID=66852 RepID=UPI00388DCD86